MNALGEKAVGELLEGYNCAQAVLYASCDRLPLEKDAALRLACGLGAGMGRKEEVCGAVSGGILALGLRYGRGEKEDRSRTETTYAKTRELMDRFAAKHGSCICRDLLGGCDLLTEEGQRHYKANDLLNKTCKPCVQTVGEILEDLLQ
jgi:C_GCAxxG_C_C family probable redox protein